MIRSARLTICTQFFFFQRSYGWSRLTQPGTQPFQGAPRLLKSVDGISSGSHVRKTDTPFFRMQRDAFLAEATPAHEFGSMKDPLPSNTTMLPLSITPDTASKGLRTLSPWNVTRLEMSLPPCRSVRTIAANSADCLSFHLQGPRIVVFSPSPWTVSDQHLANRLGFTADSRAPESTVISRYRPRLPPVSTGLLSTDMLPIVTVFRSTSSGNHAPSLELSLGATSF